MMEKYGVEDPKAAQRMEYAQVQRRLEALRLASYGPRRHKETESEIARLEARERELEEELERDAGPREPTT